MSGVVVCLLGLLVMNGCARTELHGIEPGPVVQLVGAETEPGDVVSAAQPSGEISVSARLVSREGPGDYQRTTVPPGFLVLMLGVPLLILLL